MFKTEQHDQVKHVTDFQSTSQRKAFSSKLMLTGGQSLKSFDPAQCALNMIDGNTSVMGRYDNGLTKHRRDEGIGLQIMLLQCRGQNSHGIIKSLDAKPKCLEVGGDGERRAQIQMCFYGLRRSHVDNGSIPGSRALSSSAAGRARSEGSPTGSVKSVGIFLENGDRNLYPRNKKHYPSIRR